MPEPPPPPSGPPSFDSSSWDPPSSPPSGPPGVPPPPDPSDRAALRPVPVWLSESFRLCVDRAGHLFTIIVVISFPIDLLATAAAWLGLRDLVITIADDNTVSAEGATPWLGVAALALSVGLFAKAVVGIAAARHVLAARTGVPELWSDTLRFIAVRALRISGAVLLFALAFAGFYLAVALALAGLGAVVPLPGVLGFVAGAFALLALLGRIGLGPIAAGVAPPGFGGLRRSVGLTKGLTRPLVVRLAMLAMIGLTMVLIAGFFSAPFLGGDPIQIDERPLVLSDLFGTDPAGFAVGQAISSLVLGAFAALAGGAFGLLFADLGGPLDPSITDVDPNGVEPAWPDLGSS